MFWPKGKEILFYLRTILTFGERSRERNVLLSFTICKILVNVSNFINILRVLFLYESASCSFSLVMFWLKHSFVIFGAKFLYKKCACKMLMKLTPGVNFINILLAAFIRADFKSTKWHWWLDYLFGLWGSVHVKAARKHVEGKSTSDLWEKLQVRIIN